MTEKLYGRELLHTLQYQAYASDYALAQTYTDSEIQAAYEADTKSYDRVSWEYVTVSGAAETTTDAQGDAVAATRGGNRRRQGSRQGNSGRHPQCL